MSAKDARVEAARYALLRRLAPALRHGLVGKLHPVGLMSETLARRLRSAPDIGHARDSLEKIHELSRSAVAACGDLVSWLAPTEESAISLNEGVAECIALLATDFSMRGHHLVSELPVGQASVSRAAVRSLVSAALIAQVDSLERPVNIVVRSAQVRGGSGLVIDWHDADRDFLPAPDDVYRRLEWDDVQSLANAESVRCERSARSINLQFLPVAPAPGA